MGLCTTKPKRDKASEEKKSLMLPPSFYLWREESCMLSFEGDQVTKYPFASKCKVRKDAASGVSGEGVLHFAGGTSSLDTLTIDFVVINPKAVSAEKLPNLPLACKLGHLIKFGQWVYYVGGITNNKDDDALDTESGIPLMRFNTRSQSWEIFRNEDRHRGGTLGIHELFNPGTFLQKGKIYFFGGCRLNKQGRRKPNNKVFSLNVQGDALEFRQVAFDIPVNLSSPKCGTGENGVIILGGHDPLNPTLINRAIYWVDNNQKVIQLEGLPFAITGNYPLIFSERKIVLFSKNDIAVLSLDTKKWETFDRLSLKSLQGKNSISVMPGRMKKNFVQHDRPISTKMDYKIEKKRDSSSSSSNSEDLNGLNNYSTKHHRKTSSGDTSHAYYYNENGLMAFINSAHTEFSPDSESDNSSSLDLNAPEKRIALPSSQEQNAIGMSIGIEHYTPGAVISLGKDKESKNSSERSSSSSQQKKKAPKINIREPKMGVEGKGKTSSKSKSSSSDDSGKELPKTVAQPAKRNQFGIKKAKNSSSSSSEEGSNKEKKKAIIKKPSKPDINILAALGRGNSSYGAFNQQSEGAAVQKSIKDHEKANEINTEKAIENEVDMKVVKKPSDNIEVTPGVIGFSGKIQTDAKVSGKFDMDDEQGHQIRKGMVENIKGRGSDNRRKKGSSSNFSSSNEKKKKKEVFSEIEVKAPSMKVEHYNRSSSEELEIDAEIPSENVEHDDKILYGKALLDKDQERKILKGMAEDMKGRGSYKKKEKHSSSSGSSSSGKRKKKQAPFGKIEIQAKMPSGEIATEVKRTSGKFQLDKDQEKKILKGMAEDMKGHGSYKKKEKHSSSSGSSSSGKRKKMEVPSGKFQLDKDQEKKILKGMAEDMKGRASYKKKEKHSSSSGSSSSGKRKKMEVPSGKFQLDKDHEQKILKGMAEDMKIRGSYKKKEKHSSSSGSSSSGKRKKMEVPSGKFQLDKDQEKKILKGMAEDMKGRGSYKKKEKHSSSSDSSLSVKRKKKELPSGEIAGKSKRPSGKFQLDKDQEHKILKEMAEDMKGGGSNKKLHRGSSSSSEKEIEKKVLLIKANIQDRESDKFRKHSGSSSSDKKKSKKLDSGKIMISIQDEKEKEYSSSDDKKGSSAKQIEVIPKDNLKTKEVADAGKFTVEVSKKHPVELESGVIPTKEGQKRKRRSSSSSSQSKRGGVPIAATIEAPQVFSSNIERSSSSKSSSSSKKSGSGKIHIKKKSSHSKEKASDSQGPSGKIETKFYPEKHRKQGGSSSSRDDKNQAIEIPSAEIHVPKMPVSNLDHEELSESIEVDLEHKKESMKRTKSKDEKDIAKGKLKGKKNRRKRNSSSDEDSEVERSATAKVDLRIPAGNLKHERDSSSSDKDHKAKVRSVNIVSGKVPSSKIDSGKVPSGKIVSGKVPSGKIVSGKVPSGKIDSGKVPSAKMGSTEIIPDKFKRKSSSSSSHKKKNRKDSKTDSAKAGGKISSGILKHKSGSSQSSESKSKVSKGPSSKVEIKLPAHELKEKADSSSSKSKEHSHERASGKVNLKISSIDPKKSSSSNEQVEKVADVVRVTLPTQVFMHRKQSSSHDKNKIEVQNAPPAQVSLKRQSSSSESSDKKESKEISGKIEVKVLKYEKDSSSSSSKKKGFKQESGKVQTKISPAAVEDVEAPENKFYEYAESDEDIPAPGKIERSSESVSSSDHKKKGKKRSGKIVYVRGEKKHKGKHRRKEHSSDEEDYEISEAELKRPEIKVSGKIQRKNKSSDSGEKKMVEDTVKIVKLRKHKKESYSSPSSSEENSQSQEGVEPLVATKLKIENIDKRRRKSSNYDDQNHKKKFKERDENVVVMPGTKKRRSDSSSSSEKRKRKAIAHAEEEIFVPVKQGKRKAHKKRHSSSSSEKQVSINRPSGRTMNDRVNEPQVRGLAAPGGRITGLVRPEKRGENQRESTASIELSRQNRQTEKTGAPGGFKMNRVPTISKRKKNSSSSSSSENKRASGVVQVETRDQGRMEVSERDSHYRKNDDKTSGRQKVRKDKKKSRSSSSSAKRKTFGQLKAPGGRVSGVTSMSKSHGNLPKQSTEQVIKQGPNLNARKRKSSSSKSKSSHSSSSSHDHKRKKHSKPKQQEIKAPPKAQVEQPRVQGDGLYCPGGRVSGVTSMSKSHGSLPKQSTEQVIKQGPNLNARKRKSSSSKSKSSHSSSSSHDHKRKKHSKPKQQEIKAVPKAQAEQPRVQGDGLYCPGGKVSGVFSMSKSHGSLPKQSTEQVIKQGPNLNARKRKSSSSKSKSSHSSSSSHDHKRKKHSKPKQQEIKAVPKAQVEQPRVQGDGLYCPGGRVTSPRVKEQNRDEIVEKDKVRRKQIEKREKEEKRDAKRNKRDRQVRDKKKSSRKRGGSSDSERSSHSDSKSSSS